MNELTNNKDKSLFPHLTPTLIDLWIVVESEVLTGCHFLICFFFFLYSITGLQKTLFFDDTKFVVTKKKMLINLKKNVIYR